MSRRVMRGAATVMAAAVAGLPFSALADEGGSSGTTANSDSDTGEIDATAGTETTASGGTSGASPAGVTGPRCTFVPASDVTQVPGAGTGPIVRDRDTSQLVPAPGPNTETLYQRRCPGQPPGWVWVPDDAAEPVNVQALVEEAYDTVTRRLPNPSMNMNPDPSVGGIVNIGLWLAVDDPGLVSATASVGPVWATVNAQYQSTTWSMGTGDIVECDGLGTPIVDTSTVEQGPCGYTYEWPSAPEYSGTDDLAYHASVSGRWVITYATSTGLSGSFDPIDRVAEFMYQVREIQTVRVAG